MAAAQPFPDQALPLAALSRADPHFLPTSPSVPPALKRPRHLRRGNAIAADLGIFNTIGQFRGFVAPYIIGRENSGSYASGMMITGLGIGALIVVARSRPRWRQIQGAGIDA